jgi:hypothetical protein
MRVIALIASLNQRKARATGRRARSVQDFVRECPRSGIAVTQGVVYEGARMDRATCLSSERRFLGGHEWRAS